MGGFDVKKCSCTDSFFKENYGMENTTIEHEIVVLHKCKVEQIEVISELLFTFLLTRKFGQREHLHTLSKYPGGHRILHR